MHSEELESQLTAEREAFEREHQQRVEALAAVISEECQHQLYALTESGKNAREEAVRRVRTFYEEALRRKTNSSGEAGEWLDLENNKLEELQQKLVLKEEEISKIYESKLSESEAQWAVRLSEAVEACQREKAAEFDTHIEQVKLKHRDDIENARKACREAEEQVDTLKQKCMEMEKVLAEKEETYNAEVIVIKDELEKLRSEMKDTQQNMEDDEKQWESLLPQASPQFSPRTRMELKLQKERLKRLHGCELKLQERKLCNEMEVECKKLRDELTLECEQLQAQLEEHFTEQLARVHTESALKNAVRVEQATQQLLAEKQNALSVLEAELIENHHQEIAMLVEEHNDVVKTFKTQLELARGDFQYEKGNQCQDEIVGNHKKAKEQLVVLCTSSQELQHVHASCLEQQEGESVDKEEAQGKLSNLQQMREKLQAVHQAELVVLQKENQSERDKYREELARVREYMEEKAQLEIEQVYTVRASSLSTMYIYSTHMYMQWNHK